MERLYFYLAKRDMRGIKMVATLDSPKEVSPVTMNHADDLDILNLPATWTNDIKKIVHSHRLEWALVIETANSYEDLKKTLRGRGYRNVPGTFNTVLGMQKMMPRRPLADVKRLPQQKVMLRKKR